VNQLRHFLLSPGFVGLIFLSAAAVGSSSPRIWRTDPTLQKDTRVVKDRVHSNHKDDLFLNAVGAVWPYGINKSAASYAASTGYDAATGFLIDRCHVLTNMHVVYTDDTVVDPPVGNLVAFAVGQTDSDTDRGALQGLKFLYEGTVIAHGDTIILSRLVHNPENDWAVIRLTTSVDGTISPMTISAIDLSQLPKHFRLSAAGFPTDHRRLRGDGFKLKDLWVSEGQVAGVVPVSTTGALIQTTIQTTPGDSGGPIYGDFNGETHIVVGIVQGFRGNGVGVSESAPNVGILLTPGTIATIRRAQGQTPCR
jgi:V8-like Glu-specific endopeptidase